jgi:hypothetical protein
MIAGRYIVCQVDMIYGCYIVFPNTVLPGGYDFWLLYCLYG